MTSTAGNLPLPIAFRWITWHGRVLFPVYLPWMLGHSLESLKAAFDQAGKHPGLSMIRVKVYYGPNELGGMGVYGRWNVGNWCEDTQHLRHEIGL